MHFGTRKGFVSLLKSSAVKFTIPDRRILEHFLGQMHTCALSLSGDLESASVAKGSDPQPRCMLQDDNPHETRLPTATECVRICETPTVR
jgi:hypothetical protein